ncbi:MAG TPA: glycosyltransferase family 39 protein [Pyrinomonadaceae bacterium]|nr:glycosyltransferase family 39 protein [Pyrinomonadaceae bacterium]
MRSNDKTWLIIFALVCVAFIALRFWNLTASCLWFDEIFSVHAAGMDFQNLVWFVAQDLIHPPLFYVLLKIWIMIGGESLFWLRFFSVFFSVISLVPFVFLCRELKLNYSTISLALFFLAANGCLIKYAQEVRMYSVLLFFALFSMWLFVRFLHLGKNIWILTLVNVLLVYTHYFGWLVVLSEITAIIVLQRIKIRQILIMFGILLLGFAPWIFAVWKAAQVNSNLGQNIGWIAAPDLATIFQFLFDLIEPFYYQQSNIEQTSVFVITIPLLLIIMTAFTLYLIDWNSETTEEKQNLILLTILTKLPILAALISSWILPYSVWGTRHLIFVFVPFAILTAIALTKIKVEPLIAIFTGLVFVLFGAAYFLQTKREMPVYIWCAWENLASNLDKNKPAKIYVFEDLVAYDLWFALRDAEKNFEIIKVNGIEDLQEDTAYFLPRGFEKVQKTDENGITGERFYIAYRDSVFNEKHPPLRNLINKGYQIGEPKVFNTPGLKGFLVEVWKSPN